MYIERGGKPYLYTGAAIRVDGYTHFGERSFDEMEEQFALASALGVNTVQVQIVWGDMEPQKDVYDFRQLRKMLDWAFGRTATIRIDTHRKNIIMHHILQSYGFTKCGVILLENGDPRDAYMLTKE